MDLALSREVNRQGQRNRAINALFIIIYSHLFSLMVLASSFRLSFFRHLRQMAYSVHKETQYVLFADNLSNFKDVHFKLVGFID